MITGELKNRIDSIWNIFWTGGLTNPLYVIEQMTYLMFIHDLDETDTRREKESIMLGLPYKSIFAGDVTVNDRTIDGAQLKWSVFHDFPAGRMYAVMSEYVFPFIKNLHGDKQSAYSKYMDDAIFKLPTPLMLEKVVTAMDELYLLMKQTDSADVRGDVYEYLLSKIATAGVNGQFRTPRHIIRMMVELMAPTPQDTICDPACGSGGMFVQTGDFVNQAGMSANSAMTFYGQEKVEYNAQLCMMNMAVHGLNGRIASGNEANTFYYDAHGLDGCCDYIMANPPFNVDKVNAESTMNMGRLPFGMPAVNKAKEVGNANYLWISYFYSYLNETGRAGFVMASSATDSSGKDRDIRRALVETGHVDVMVSVGNNFFYTKSLPCSLWFFDKGKRQENLDQVLFIDARNYYTVVDRTLNEWSEWQLKNLNAIVWLYRGEKEKYAALLSEYNAALVMQAGMLSAQELVSALQQKETYADAVEMIEKYRAEQRELAKFDLEKVIRKEKKAVQAKWDEKLAAIDELLTVAKEALWLTEKFGEGTYQDIAGLCKLATREEIEEKNFSLTPGAYVGVAAVEDDGVDFAQRMKEIHQELLKLQAESNALMATISKNMEEMGV